MAQLAQLQLFSKIIFGSFCVFNLFYWLLQLIIPLKTKKKIFKNTLFWIQFFGPIQYLDQFKLFQALLMALIFWISSFRWLLKLITLIVPLSLNWAIHWIEPKNWFGPIQNSVFVYILFSSGFQIIASKTNYYTTKNLKKKLQLGQKMSLPKKGYSKKNDKIKEVIVKIY